MKKYYSLITACLSEGMNVFSISTKNNKIFTRIFLPIIIAFIIMCMVFSYSETIISKLKIVNMEYIVLTIFVIVTSFITLVEGIYKSGNLLFNCTDDNLLLSLPIRKSTVLFIRIFKFYLFELIFNSIFIIPAIISYAIHTNPNVLYYIVSLIALLLFPIIPILLSCIIGTITTYISSMFKGKRAIQTILTVFMLLGFLYFSYNSEKFLDNIANNASNINDFISKLYYPAGAYCKLITNFNILDLFIFIIINIGLLSLAVLLMSKFYFHINSNTKSVSTNKANKQYKIKTLKITESLIKKEFNRFLNSTVFITNAGFGMVLFIIGCILLVIKFDTVANAIIQIKPDLSIEYINNNISIILFAFICFSSFMTSITSSMISLEGKSFSILKSLPIKPYTIVTSKILAAIIIMIPCILIGDIIVFIKFKLDILSIVLILIASILFPLISETIGILVNLKYPRMDAKNDTEVVKQSISSSISVFIGIGLTIITAFLLLKAIELNMSNFMILVSFTIMYVLIYTFLVIILNKTCEKSFNRITI